VLGWHTFVAILENYRIAVQMLEASKVGYQALRKQLL
jgi:hypothetical protein